MKKIGIVILFHICMIMAGCSQENSQNENLQILEQSSEEADLYDSQVSIMETEGTQDWEQEMYDERNFVEDMEEQEDIAYIAEEYGEIQEYGSEFYYEEDVMGYYYNMENFYLNSDFLYTMNDTLQKFYDSYLYQYRETENWYMEQGEFELPEGKVPYSELKFLGVKYVDNDYISLLFNDITYMGGANPYYLYDAITIDRHTGKEVAATEILAESDSDILETVSDLMGMDVTAAWSEIDFYLTEEKIVFFYRMPGIWEEVVLGR